MLGFKPRMSPGRRPNWWARQVARQQSTNVPVAQFCQQLGVPTSTFYGWRRLLAQPSATSSQSARVGQPSPNPVRRDQTSTVAASFVPVSIKSSRPRARHRRRAAQRLRGADLWEPWARNRPARTGANPFAG
jgi:hypothetical protein